MRRNDLPAAKEVVLEALSEKFERSGADESVLDDLVHDVASGYGALVNNSGPTEQIRFLLEEGVFVDVIEAAIVAGSGEGG